MLCKLTELLAQSDHFAYGALGAILVRVEILSIILSHKIHMPGLIDLDFSLYLEVGVSVFFKIILL